MNLQESEIELELRALRPRSPSHELEEKIGRELAPMAIAVAERVPAAAVLRRAPAAPARWWHGLGWAFAGAAVAVLAFVGYESFSTARPPAVASAAAATAPDEMLEHVDASAQIVAEEDEGLVLSENAEPARRVRYISYERHVWTNPATGAVMEYTVPREDVRLTPIALQ